MSKNKFYLTAAIPYVNAKPHLGHALEFVQGDVLARWHRLRGIKTFYVSGADENSLKVVRAAEEGGVSVQEFADKNTKEFVDFLKLYHVSLDKFQRSSSPEHKDVAQDFWRACEKSGAIYKKKYKGLYCVSCEVFYQKEELDEKGQCLYHPGKMIEEVEEENYFFKLSEYQDKLIDLIESDAYKIRPLSRKNEARAFIKHGLDYFSISRSVERAKGWGVSVPNDPGHIMYVWFDALNVYRSAAPHYWPADLHIIGKDILRFHAVYWPAMLLAAGESLPKELFVHGFITSNGKKMSKSLGNVVDPVALVEKYGVDAVRYYLLREIPSDDDGDFSEESFIKRYNGDLANGLGNFASRVLTLAEAEEDLAVLSEGALDPDILRSVNVCIENLDKKIEERRFHEAIAEALQLTSVGDGYLNNKTPWKMESGEEKSLVLSNCLFVLDKLTHAIAPFLPETRAKLDDALKAVDGVWVVKKLKSSLFPRL